MNLVGRGIYLGGGLRPVLAVTVALLEPTLVTATLGTTTVPLVLTGDVWMAQLPRKGTWTVTATDGVVSKSVQVEVDRYYVETTVRLFPDGYVPLEYIQSTGTQYIDTGVADTSGVYMHVKFSATNKTERNIVVLGAESSPAAGTRSHVILHSDGKDYLALGAGNVFDTTIIPSINTIYDVRASSVIGDSHIYVDGEIRATGNNNGTRTSQNLYLFAGGKLGSAFAFFTGKIYECELSSHNNVLQRRFFSAKRLSDNAIGMIDLANNAAWYGNAGTGVFIAGPEIT